MSEIIDAHHHLWRYIPEDYGWITAEMRILQRNFLPDDLERELNSSGVKGSVVVQARQSLIETQWLLELAEQYSTIRGVVGWLPLTDEAFPAILRDLVGHRKLKGVRHVIQDELDDLFILRNDFNRGIASLLDSGLVYDILIQDRHLPQTVKFVKQHPRQIFVLDHLAKPRIGEKSIEPWRENLARLADSRNVYCKLSGLVTEVDWATWTLDNLRPYLDAALHVFGAERLMAGSDWPVCLLASSYERWWTTLFEWLQTLGVTQQQLILGKTASKVYGLETSSIYE